MIYIELGEGRKMYCGKNPWVGKKGAGVKDVLPKKGKVKCLDKRYVI